MTEYKKDKKDKNLNKTVDTLSVVDDKNEKDTKTWNFEVHVDEPGQDPETEEEKALRLKAQKEFEYDKPKIKTPTEIIDLERQRSMSSDFSLESIRRPENPLDAPKTADQDSLSTFQVENANLQSRFLSTIIDFGIFFFLINIFSKVEPLIRSYAFPQYAKIDYSNELHLYVYFIWIGLIQLFVFVIPILTIGNTIGKMIFSVQHEDIDGGPPSKVAILLREMLYKPFICATVVGLLPIFTESKYRQGTHDKLTNIRMINKI